MAQAHFVAEQLQAAVVQEAPERHQWLSPDQSHMQHLHRLCTTGVTNNVLRIEIITMQAAVDNAAVVSGQGLRA